MPRSKPASERKNGDKFVDEYGEFWVVKPDLEGCNGCDHKLYPCVSMGCSDQSNVLPSGFRLLTEINYITHRLTKS